MNEKRNSTCKFYAKNINANYNVTKIRWKTCKRSTTKQKGFENKQNWDNRQSSHSFTVHDNFQSVNRHFTAFLCFIHFWIASKACSFHYANQRLVPYYYQLWLGSMDSPALAFSLCENKVVIHWYKQTRWWYYSVDLSLEEKLWFIDTVLRSHISNQNAEINRSNDDRISVGLSLEEVMWFIACSVCIIKGHRVWCVVSNWTTFLYISLTFTCHWKRRYDSLLACIFINFGSTPELAFSLCENKVVTVVNK